MLEYILKTLFPKTINKIVNDEIIDRAIIKEFGSLEAQQQHLEFEAMFNEIPKEEWEKMAAEIDEAEAEAHAMHLEQDRY